MEHTKTLAQVCTGIFAGLSAGRNSPHQAVQAVGLKALHASGVVLPDAIETYVPANHPAESSLLRTGDVLVAARGSLAKAALIEDSFATPLYATGNVTVLRHGPDLDPTYLWAFVSALCAEPGCPQFRRVSTGQLSMRVVDLQNLSLPMRSLDEQKELGIAARSLRHLMSVHERVLDQSGRVFTSFLRDRVLTQ